jgi:hypothetical protein
LLKKQHKNHKKAGNFALTPDLKDFLTQVFYENKDSIAFIAG